MERFFTPVEDYAVDLQERIKVVHHVFQDLLPAFFNKLSMEYFKEIWLKYKYETWVMTTAPAQQLFTPHLFKK